MAKTSITTLLSTFLLLALTCPCCSIAPSTARAQATGENSWAPAPIGPRSESETRQALPTESGPPPAAVSPGVSAPEPVEVQKLRAARQKQASVFRELQLVREEQRALAHEDRVLYPITGPLIAMGVGFGMSAVSLGIAFLASWTMPSSDSPISNDLKLKLIALQVVGLPTGFIGLGVLRYRLNHRQNGERIRELETKRRDLRLKLRQLEQNPWSIVPDVSAAERRAGLSVRHAF